MITYQWDHDDLAYVQKKLGSMSAHAPRALRDAVNNTAVTARKLLLQEAQKRYTVKASGFNSRANIVKATLATQTAWIKVNGKPLSMPRYHYTAPRSGVRAEILAGTGLKPVVGSSGIKAFRRKVATGKKNVEAGRIRTHSEEMTGKRTDTSIPKSEKSATLILQRVGEDRYPLKALTSPSVPKQIEMVYDGRSITSTPLKKEIEKIYQANVDKQIQRFLNQ